MYVLGLAVEVLPLTDDVQDAVVVEELFVVAAADVVDRVEKLCIVLDTEFR